MHSPSSAHEPLKKVTFVMAETMPALMALVDNDSNEDIFPSSSNGIISRYRRLIWGPIL